MKQKTKKTIITVLCCILCVGLIAGVSAGIFEYTLKVGRPNRYNIQTEKFDGSLGSDRIHFLNTFGSDCILIESDGRFALVDAAEDSDNPRNFEGLALDGYESTVIEYLKNHAAGEDGKVYLDFVVGTHSHSDHIGGFDAILQDEDIFIEKAYIKEYNAEVVTDYEREKWDNQEVFDQMVDAVNNRGGEVIFDVPSESFGWQNFECTFFNTEYYTGNELWGENENALGFLLKKGDKTALLMGDVNNIRGTETEIAQKVGKIDLLKLGHHGYSDSTTREFVKIVQPDIGIITGTIHNLNTETKFASAFHAKTAFIATIQHKGLIASFTDDGEIVITDQTHETVAIPPVYNEE